METNVLFVHFHKAFDTIEHSYLWKCLENQSISTQIINYKKTYKGSKALCEIGPRNGKHLKLEGGKTS